jgi:hypothetical protein
LSPMPMPRLSIHEHPSVGHDLGLIHFYYEIDPYCIDADSRYRGI